MSETKMVEIGKIITNPQQPRRYFDQVELESLAASMASSVGLIQPITVENDGTEVYILVDGERRYRAAKLLGWPSIEAVIRPISNHDGTERLLSAFVANEQRTDMNALERAKAYKALMDNFGSIQEVVKMTGKSTGTIQPHLAILEFEPEIQQLFEKSTLVASTRVIAALRRLEPERRLIMASVAATRGVSESALLTLCNRFAKTAIVKRFANPDKVEPVKFGEHFDAINMVPKKMLPLPVITTTHATCASCELYDMASAVTCRQCPLVDFLRRYE